MTKREFVSRVSNQVRMVSKDDYISDRLVLFTGMSIARKLITQKIQRRSIDRSMNLYTEITCLEFEPVDIFKCNYVEFKSCDKLSRSKKPIKDLIYTRYGSSLKELYSIDRKYNFKESTLYQLRNDSERQNSKASTDKFYLLEDHIYIPMDVCELNALAIHLDPYDLNQLSSCSDKCKSAWEYDFVCPDSMLEDVLSYTIQNLLQSKSIQEDEAYNLNNAVK